jgi:hypothetical protein
MPAVRPAVAKEQRWLHGARHVHCPGTHLVDGEFVVNQLAKEIMQLDLHDLRIKVAELMGYTEMVVDAAEKMQGEMNGIMVEVPNYPVDPVHASDLLTRLEWDGVPYALRHEAEGPGDHFGFYLRGTHVLGPSRAIAICRGFLLAEAQVSHSS